MENQRITKSIIYGNAYENRYGKFLPLCSSISDRTSIEHILQYLKQSSHFKKYNRLAYAYRVQEMPVVFITEKKNQQPQYYEGCHSDQTIEGSGQKLLHLLQKFNIQNVVVAVIIQQFNPLLPFESTNYRAIVQNSRLLLDQLYKKVINFQQQIINKNNNDLLYSNEKIIKMKKVDMLQKTEIPQIKKNKQKQRPNHLYSSNSKPNFNQSKINQNPYSHEIGFLVERSKNMKEQFASLIEGLEEKQIQQMKYFVMYDKNNLINIVISMFLTFQGITKQCLIQEFDFATIKAYECERIEKPRLKKLSELLSSNRKLNVDNVLKINRGIGMLFSLMEIKIRYSKTLQRIDSLMAKTINQTTSNEMHINSNKIVTIDPVK